MDIPSLLILADLAPDSPVTETGAAGLVALVGLVVGIAIVSMIVLRRRRRRHET